MCPTCSAHFRKVRIFLDADGKVLCDDDWHDVAQVRRAVGRA